MDRSVVSTWIGTFLLEDSTVVRGVRAPSDPGSLADRIRARREGRLTPEEETVLADRDGSEWKTRDRRLADHGLRWSPTAAGPAVLPRADSDRGTLRAALLLDAERALEAAWDPSVHLQEAVRAFADLDRIRNLLGERLGSWVSRDVPDLDPGDHARVVEAALSRASDPRLGPSDPALGEARRQLAELYRAVEQARSLLEQSVNAASPRETPNLARLLGADLSARLVAQAGGLERLARLPASTIQVLGAEKAFFEHLRGHAPPPRHGLLFLHPAIQSATRRDRGRLARALAGKVSIAARLDHAGAPVHPALERSFAARRDALRARRTSNGATRRPRRRSRPPLHRAPENA
jgi:nucleolar protein 56